jgi:hypothetical protein
MSARMDDLRAELVELAASIEFPTEPNLAPLVADRIRAGVRPQPAPRQLIARRGFAVSLAVAVVLVSAVMVLSPSTRHAVADFLGIGGARIEFSNEPAAGIATDLQLGDRVSLDEAAGRVDFDLRVPSELGEPDEVYVKRDLVTVFVSMAWRANDDLPRATSTGVGALLTEFRSDVEVDFIKKLIGGGTELTRVTVDGTDAFWVKGPHSFMLLDEEGRPREDTARLSANTLLWEREGITYRLEGAFDLDAAARIADSLG